MGSESLGLCPKCNAPRDYDAYLAVRWVCGSILRMDETVCDGVGCLIRQRDAKDARIASLAAEVERLKAENEALKNTLFAIEHGL